MSEFVVEPFTVLASIDFNELQKAVRIAVSGLNQVLDEGIPMHPLKEQREMAREWRQIGLGTLGLGDMLIKLGIKYGSQEALELIEMIYRTIARTAIMESNKMAVEKGPFPACTEEIASAIIKSDFVQNLGLDYSELDMIKRFGLRNSQLLTCAPTGTIGTMLQVSTGVEPNYAFSYNRRTVSLNDEETTYKVDAKIVREYKEATGKTKLPSYFVAAQDIGYKDRIAVQSTLQLYIDASISSTINLPHETTVEEVADLYLEAWKQGLKGVTIWRDRCQRQAILSTDKPKEEKKEEEKPVAAYPTPIKKASDDSIGRKRTLVTGCGTLHLSCWFDRQTGQLLETYFNKGSQGGCALFMVGLSRMVSLAARGNISVYDIVDQLKSSGTCPSYAVRTATKRDTSKGASCPVAIGNALIEMYEELQEELKAKGILASVPKKPEEEPKETSDSPKCPKCGEPVRMVEGCMTCPSCGYSKCG